MIYQLKISLKGTKPPVWRRVQVHGNITFGKLHEIIQACFEWEDEHLHEFYYNERVSKRIVDTYTIGPYIEELMNTPFYVEPEIDEDEVVLFEFLAQEKDKCRYVYDFGDYWEHEVLLEKIITDNLPGKFPKCITARRGAPQENSRFVWKNNEDVDNKRLVNMINERFHTIEEYDNIDDKDFERANYPIDEQIWSNLFRLVEEYNNLAAWDDFEDDRIIALKLPNYDDWLFCSILGNAGIEYGLAVYIGQAGLKTLNKITYSFEMDEEVDSFDLLTGQRSLLLSFSDWHDLKAEDKHIALSINHEFRKNHTPLFRSMEPGLEPWFFSEEEALLLTDVLAVLLPVLRNLIDTNRPIPFFSLEKEIYAIVATGEAENFQEQTVIPETLLVEEEEILHISEIEYRKIQKEFRVKAYFVNLDVFYFPIPAVMEEGDERPFFPLFLLAVDDVNKKVIHLDVTASNHFSAENIQRQFFALIKTIGFIPKGIQVANEELYKKLLPLTEKLAIEMYWMEEIEELTTIKEMIISHAENDEDFFSS